MIGHLSRRVLGRPAMMTATGRVAPVAVPPASSARSGTADIGAPSRFRGGRIVVRGVGREFDGPDGPVRALGGIDLDVAPGEFLVVVGPSGCGKTTLLRIMAGLDQPTEGTLTMARSDGTPPSNAMVFQGRSVYPWLTVRDNVAYGLKLRGAGKRERNEIADALLATVGLAKFATAFPHQLSEGMRHRVAIARAFAVDPDILLMDEPFGALDEQTKFLLQEELLRIWENSGKTVVFITHSIDEALTLADRIVVMSAHPGTIKATLTVPFDRPRNIAQVRSDPAFAELFNEIWGLLRDEVLAARQGQERLAHRGRP